MSCSKEAYELGYLVEILKVIIQRVVTDLDNAPSIPNKEKRIKHIKNMLIRYLIQLGEVHLNCDVDLLVFMNHALKYVTMVDDEEYQVVRDSILIDRKNIKEAL